MRRLVLGLAWALALTFQAPAQELSNDTLRLQLGVTPEGIPVVREALWKATGRTAFRDLGTSAGLGAWVPAALIPASPSAPPVWSVSQGEDFITAEATRELANKMRMTWIVELPNQGQLFRLRIRLTNGGKKARAVEWFPAWSASWDVGGPAQWARWWPSLLYRRVEQPFNVGSPIRLGSRLHSSDDAAGGVNPYWVVGGPAGRVYFGLQWCGGWSASLDGLGSGFGFAVRLPPEETQLVLGKRETIEGPALLVTPVAGADEADDRAIWMKQRQALAEALFGGPPPSFELSYNHWYAVRQRVDANFINRQIALMPPYAFRAFVLDAGWFADGRWKPDKAKFPAGSFEAILTSLQANGLKIGLWSTPQYVNSSNSPPTLELEQPPVFNRFFGGYLVDLSGESFAHYLAGHVQTLRSKYLVDYWKYDQPFFTEASQAGAMKNVVGFQKALQAVRQANPDLTVENCSVGGRMINDFTLLATQTSWLKDVGIGGLPDPQDNIRSALGALDFVFPWAALRFTLNLNELEQSDDELTRLYCRSAMAGRWAISTDLSQITERQQNVILNEIAHYRRLCRLKKSCLYDLELPTDGAEVAGVTFYSGSRSRAGVLLYRWQRDGAFEGRVVLARLNPALTYRVVDADTGSEVSAAGSELQSPGVTVSFSSQRRSALLFVEAVAKTPAP